MSNHANSGWRAPRLMGTGAVLLGVLVLGLVAYSGGAAAAVGPTDLALTKSDSPDPVVQGNNLTYTIRVTNDGTNDASGVTVNDTLPSQVDYVSSSTTAGTCKKTGSTVSCDLGPLDAGTTQTVTIVVKAKKSGAISNTATVTSTSPDTNLANNSDTEGTTVTKPVKPGKKKVKQSCATPSIAGTPANDVLIGTPGNDIIVSYSGDDQVFAGGGSDLICTGLGNDLVAGGAGGDTAIGGAGRDSLKGGTGPDILKGKAGRDKLRGQRGNDLLNGGRGFDSCKGGAGRDVLKSCP